MISVVFESEHIRVLKNFDDRPQEVVVCFQSYVEAPAFSLVPFGMQFVESAGLAGVFVHASSNHWYQTPDVQTAMSAVRALTQQSRVITYGSSMGAYAALIHSRTLDAEVVIAISPQASMDPKKVPFEDRWSEATKLTFLWDDLKGGMNPLATKFVLFDSVDKDARHADLISRASPETMLIPIPFGGHPVIECLVRAGVMRRLFFDLATLRMSRSEIRVLVKSASRDTRIYWGNLAVRAGYRRPSLARYAMRRHDALRGAATADRQLDNIRASVLELFPEDRAFLANAAFESRVEAGAHVRTKLGIGRRDAILGDGWSVPERDGTWMVGNLSQILFRPQTLKWSMILVEIHLVEEYRGKMRPQSLVVEAGSSSIFRGSPGKGCSIRLLIMHSEVYLQPGGLLTLNLIHTDAASPFVHGLSSDTRRLSFKASCIDIWEFERN